MPILSVNLKDIIRYDDEHPQHFFLHYIHSITFSFIYDRCTVKQTRAKRKPMFTFVICVATSLTFICLIIIIVF